LVTKQPTPEGPIPITAVPLDNQGHVAVANLGNKPLTLSKLNSTAGVECDFGGTVTIQPGGQAICTIPPKSGKIVLYGSGTGSTEIELSGVAEVIVTSSPGFSSTPLSQTTEDDFEEGHFENTTTASPEVRLVEVPVSSVIDASGFDFMGASGDEVPRSGLPFGLAYGDLNNDGRNDLVVSSYEESSHEGKIYIKFGPHSGSSASPDVFINGSNRGMVGPNGRLGDINGDGIDDLVYGEECETSNCTGRLHIVYGPISSGNYVIDDLSNVTINGSNNEDHFGYTVYTYDVNKDGKMDILVGAYGYPAGDYKGIYYLIYGRQFSGSYNISDVYNASFIGSQNDDYVGAGPVAFGDFNGDGYVDLAIGNPYVDTGGSDSGQVLIYYGPLFGDYQLSDANVTINASVDNCRLGYDVYAYDINSDGKDDLLTSTPYYNGGRGFVLYSPLHSMSITVSESKGGDLQSNANITFYYSGSNTDFGSAIRAARLKGDNTIYVVMGWRAKGDSSDGAVVVFINPSSGIYTVDNANITFTHSKTAEHLGSALEVGDVNGDGISDLMIGSYTYSTTLGKASTDPSGKITYPSATKEGRVYLITGGRPITCYRTSGKYYSKIFDLGRLSNLTYITWTSDEPTGTDLTIELRIGNASDVDNSSGYDILNVAGTNVSKGSISLGPGTKAQYIAYFNTSDTSKTPVLYDIQLTYKPLYTNVTYTINYASGLKWVALNRSDGTLVANETVSNCDTFYTNTEEVSTAYSYTIIYKGCDGQTKTYAVS